MNQTSEDFKTQKVNLHQTRSISETINTSFTFFRSEFVPLGKNLIYVAGPLIILSALLNYFFFNDVFGSIMADPSGGTTGLEAIFSSQYFLLMLTQILVTTVIGLIVNFYILDYMEGSGPTSVARMWQLILNKAPLYFGYMIVLFILIMLGFMFFLLPGIYLSIALILFLPAAVQENLPFGKALKRSLYLTKNYWWFTLGLILLTGIIIYIIYMIFEIPFMALGVGLGFSSGFQVTPDDIGSFYGIYVAFAQLLMLVYSFLFVVETVHFYSQREKKEARGLGEQIAELDHPSAE